MKKLLLSTLITFISIFAFAQVHVVAPDGNTGIGTQTPSEKLEVIGLVQSEGGTVKTTGASASTLYNRTDYAAMVRSYGGWAEGPISNPSDLSRAFKEAVKQLEEGNVAVVDVRTML